MPARPQGARISFCYTGSMLTLYMRPTCPFCQKVMKRGIELGVAFDLKDISNPENATALLAKGGKQQVPFLVDTGEVDTPSGVPVRQMYESSDIVQYLDQHYSRK